MTSESDGVAGEQAPPPLPPLHRFACARRARTAKLQGSNFFSGGQAPLRRNCRVSGVHAAGHELTREGLRALSHSPGAGTPRSRNAANPLSTPRPPRSGQPPPPPKQRRLSAANLPIDPAPAAQRPAPAASQTTALIRRKAPIDPAPAAQRPASRRHRPIAERRRFKG